MKNITRRGFVKTITTGALALAATPVLSKVALAYKKRPDMIAVKGENIEEMFLEAIKEYGGLPINKGDKVCIKPNMAWAIDPDGAANTTPELVAAIIRESYAAGASKVYVFDHTCDDWEKAYERSGVKKAAEDAGAIVADGHLEKNYRYVENPKGKILKFAQVHELILDSDVVINVPVCKHHGGAGLSSAMKNMMGMVWDRKSWHGDGLHQCIADCCHLIKPTVNIVDAYKIILSGGPRGNFSSKYKMAQTLLISEDIVAIDAASAKTFGAEPEEFDYITLAAAAGIGTLDLDKLDIRRLVL